jgi:hypothetical protein
VGAERGSGVDRGGSADRDLRPDLPAPPEALPEPPHGPDAAGEAFGQAVDHGDEHVIKFADTAADVYARTGNPAALAAAIRAVRLVPRDT